MKLILTTLLLIFVTTSSTLASQKKESKYNERLCKIFTQKAKEYEKTMRDDSYAHTTLESYKKRAKLFCTK